MIDFLWGLTKALAVLIVLILVAAGALEFLLPQEPVRAWCAGQLEARLHRKVQIAALSAGPWRGVSVEGLAVSQGKDFDSGAWLEVSSARARWRWASLLAGRLELAEVVLAGPRLKLTGPAPVLELSPEAERYLPTVSVASLRVSEGRLTWPGPSGEAVLTDIAGALSGLGPASEARLKASFKWQAAGTTPPPSEGALEARFRLDGAYLLVESSGSAVLARPAAGASRFESARVEWSLRESLASPLKARGRIRVAAESGVLALPAPLPSTGTWAGALWAPLAALARTGKADLRRPRPVTELRCTYVFTAGPPKAGLSLKGPGLSVVMRPPSAARRPAPVAAPGAQPAAQSEDLIDEAFSEYEPGRVPPAEIPGAPRPAKPATLDELLAP